MFKRMIAGIALTFTMVSTAADKVELEIEYPEKLVKGTEVPKGIPNVEKPRAKGSKPKNLMVPAGCTNIAEDMGVSASDEDPSVGDLDLITDADADGNEYVQLITGLQWVQIDLEDRK
ncbi:MAG: hypothetical protein HRT88_06625 [Lentisphaeraceae bacterium]|nr:hypothetical protein [Lentisphaeraceae bacterium]